MKYALPAALALSLVTTGVVHAQTASGGGASPGAMTGSGLATSPNSGANATTATGANPGLGTSTAGRPNNSGSAGNSVAVTTSANGQQNSTRLVPGANSFTEGEARARIQDRGFGQVTGLKLDNQGIWRGTATKDGKTASVGLDYQGNLVAQ